MSVFFNGISFVWTLVALAAFMATLGLRAWLGYRRLTSEANADWDYRVSKNMQDLRLDRAGFVRAYRKVNAPRLSLYLAGGAAMILALTPFVFGLINLLLWGVWKFSDESRVFEPGYLVWEFSIFFALIAAWALIGAGVARRYHATGPGLMRDELIAERENFAPTQRLTVGPNPLHIDGGKLGDSYHDMFTGVLGLAHELDKNWNDSGHMCKIYSDGSDMKICVHNTVDDNTFEEGSHPFFFLQKHSREDVEELRYSLIMSLKNTHAAFEKIEKLDFLMEKTTGNKHSRMRSFCHENLDVFLYEKDRTGSEA